MHEHDENNVKDLLKSLSSTDKFWNFSFGKCCSCACRAIKSKPQENQTHAIFESRPIILEELNPKVKICCYHI